MSVTIQMLPTFSFDVCNLWCACLCRFVFLPQALEGFENVVRREKRVNFPQCSCILGEMQSKVQLKCIGEE
jgi:hypothetical protein